MTALAATVPWLRLEPVASRLARVAATGRLREGDAWALAVVYVTEIIEDVTAGELSRWIGIVGEPRWLAVVVGAIARRRGVDPEPWVKKAQETNVFEEERDERGGEDHG